MAATDAGVQSVGSFEEKTSDIKKDINNGVNRPSEGSAANGNGVDDTGNGHADEKVG